MRKHLLVLVISFAVALSPHAGDSALKAQERDAQGKARVLQGTITVSAASSLSDPFVLIAKSFRKINPKTKIRFNFGSSSSLVAQIQAGAPSDVIASADLESIEKLVKSGAVSRVDYPQVFAHNQMAIAVKLGNPLKINSISDFPRANYIALCTINAPCGIYAAQVLGKALVVINESKITRAVDARATLNAVAFGDADAAIVYLTDVLSAKKYVDRVEIGSSQNVKTAYALGAIRSSKNQDLAEAFISYVLSSDGQAVLKSFGFAKR